MWKFLSPTLVRLCEKDASSPFCQIIHYTWHFLRLQIFLYCSYPDCFFLQPGPPMYRHPPPVPGRSTRSQEEDAINETVLSAASLNGGPMPHFYNPCDNMIWTQTGPYPQYMLTPSYPPRQPTFEQTHQQQGFEQHTKVRKKPVDIFGNLACL